METQTSAKTLAAKDIECPVALTTCAIENGSNKSTNALRSQHEYYEPWKSNVLPKGNLEKDVSVFLIMAERSVLTRGWSI